MNTALATDERFEEARNAETAADFTAVGEDFEAKLAAALAKRAELEAEQEEAIFSGGDLAKLQSDIAALSEEIRMLERARDGAARRRDEAAQREFDAETGRMAERAQTLAEEAARAFERRRVAVREARIANAEHDKAKTAVLQLNLSLDSRGRHDLNAWVKPEIEPDPAPPELGNLSKNGRGVDQLLAAVGSVNPKRLQILPAAPAFGHGLSDGRKYIPGSGTIA